MVKDRASILVGYDECCFLGWCMAGAGNRHDVQRHGGYYVEIFEHFEAGRAGEASRCSGSPPA